MQMTVPKVTYLPVLITHGQTSAYATGKGSVYTRVLVVGHNVVRVACRYFDAREKIAAFLHLTDGNLPVPVAMVFRSQTAGQIAAGNYAPEDEIVGHLDNFHFVNNWLVADLTILNRNILDLPYYIYIGIAYRTVHEQITDLCFYLHESEFSQYIQADPILSFHSRYQQFEELPSSNDAMFMSYELLYALKRGELIDPVFEAAACNILPNIHMNVTHDGVGYD